MKYIVSVLVILMHIKQVMPIFVLPSELREGDEKADDGNKCEALLNDNPNFGQLLLSDRFISSARRLFNKKRRLSEHKHDLHRMTQERYHMKIKNEDTGKDKGDNVGYYAMGDDANEVSSENDESHSLLDHYCSNNKYTAESSDTSPVQCIKTSPLQMVCTHGGVIYKLVLPSPDLSEDDLGKLVETVYKEIEVKHKGSFLKKLYKRHTDKNENYKGNINAVKLFANESPENILQFSLPNIEHDESSIESDYQQPSAVHDDKYLSTFEQDIKNNDEAVNTRKIPPSELLNEIDQKSHPYSCRWLSKRHIETGRTNLGRRLLNRKRYKTIKSSRKPSVNEGKAGTCQIMKKHRYKSLSSPSVKVVTDIRTQKPLLSTLYPALHTRCRTFKNTTGNTKPPYENVNKELLNKEENKNQIKQKEKKKSLVVKKISKQIIPKNNFLSKKISKPKIKYFNNVNSKK